MALLRVDNVSVAPSSQRLDPEFYASPYRDFIEEALPAWKEWQPLRKAAIRLTSGHTPLGHDLETGDADFVTVECVSPLRLNPNLYKSVWTTAVHGELSRVRLSKGNVVITIKRRIVDAAVVGALDRPTAVNQDVAVLVPSSDYLPEFIAAFLVSRLGKYQALRLQTEQMNPYISVGSLGDLLIPVITKSLQRRVAAVVEALDSSLRTARTSSAAADLALTEALGLDKLDLSPQKSYVRPFKDLQVEARFDAEYYNPKYQRVMGNLRAGGVTLHDVAPISRRTFDPSKRERESSFNYIEIGSLTSDGEADAETKDVADAPSRAKWIVKPGDVITSTVRPIRRLSAMIRTEQDGFVCSSGFAVLKPKTGEEGIEPEVLLTYLRLPIICDLLDLNCTASMYPALPEDRLMRMPFVIPDANTRKFVVDKVREASEARREASRLLEQAKRTVEDVIANGGNQQGP